MTREEMIALAKKGQNVRHEHLSNCEDCRRAFELLAAFDVVGELPLPEPPLSWIKKAADISRRGRQIPIKNRLQAKLIYDSWVLPRSVGVRGAGITDHRRIEFDAEGIHLSLRAERNNGGWALIAQVEGAEGEVAELKCGRQTHCPDDEGLFQWVSKRPPRKITLRINDKLIELPELKWTKQSLKKKQNDS